MWLDAGLSQRQIHPALYLAVDFISMQEILIVRKLFQAFILKAIL